MQLDKDTAMQLGADPQATYVALRISNRGHVPCTVNAMWLLSYPSWWRYLRGRHDKSVYVLRPMTRVPYRLEHGGEFRAIALQAPELAELSRKSRLYMAISHSMSKRPFRVR